MGQYLETVRGVVPTWECDIVEHFTVAYYYDKLGMASARLLQELGFYLTDPQCPTTVDCFSRFQQELRVGGIYHIESGIISAEDNRLVFGHKLFNSETATLCTTFEQTLTCSQTVDSSKLQINWDGPERQLREDVSEQQNWLNTGADVVQPHEVDWAGNLKLPNYIHRFSSASGHTLAQIGMTPSYQRENRIGFSTFEFQLKLFSPAPRSGDALAIKSCIAHLGRTSMRYIHRLVTCHDDRTVAELSQMGVHLDKDARRPSPFPDAIRNSPLLN